MKSKTNKRNLSARSFEYNANSSSDKNILDFESNEALESYRNSQENMNDEDESSHLSMIPEEDIKRKTRLSLTKLPSNLLFANVQNINAKEKQLFPLYIICLSYLIFTLIEISAGMYSDSIALMADAVHTFSDGFAFAACVVSIIATQKGTTNEMSFGFHRAEIIGILMSAIILWGFFFWLFFSILNRLYYLSFYEVKSLVVLLVGVGCVFFNLIMGLVLMYLGIGHNEVNFKEEKNNCHRHKHSYNELNCHSVKTSYNHIIIDSIQSCIIIIAGAFMYFQPRWKIIDPIFAIVLTGLILYNAYTRLSGCVSILMEAIPSDFDMDQLEADLLDIRGVVGVHDIHVWSLSVGKISMSCHLTTSEPQISLKLARNMIKKKYNITHTTIQVELDREVMDVCKIRSFN